MSTQADILRAIIDRPDDDTPREAYADFLDEFAGTETCPHCRGTGWPNPKFDLDDRLNYAPGRVTECPPCGGRGWVPDANANRAEFIRVQVEIARHLGPAIPDGRSGIIGNNPALAALAKRERALLAAVRDDLRGQLPPSSPPWAFYLSRQGAGFDDGWALGMSRGFADRLTCPSDSWDAHGDTILAVQPLRNVRLMTTPWTDGGWTDHRRNVFHMRIGGDVVEIPEADVMNAQGYQALWGVILHARWPRIPVDGWTVPREVEAARQAGYGPVPFRSGYAAWNALRHPTNPGPPSRPA